MPKGRIIKALAGFYYVESENIVYQCRGRGVFRKRKVSPLVGDIVEFQAENEKEGTVLVIDERKNELVRPPISNVDQALLVFSVKEPDFNTLLLDRFLMLIEYHHITPVVCLTKFDLLSKQEADKIQVFIEDYKKIGYEVFCFGNDIADDVENLMPILSDKVTVLAGQSGVGKSSLLNKLRPDLNLLTNEISQSLGRGKHTTRHVELIEIGKGFVADTPGFSSLEFTELEVLDLTDCFPEIQEASQFCKFRGCTHIMEPKCQVKENVAKGEIEQYRYDHYVAFLEEIKDRKPRY